MQSRLARYLNSPQSDTTDCTSRIDYAPQTVRFELTKHYSSDYTGATTMSLRSQCFTCVHFKYRPHGCALSPGTCLAHACTAWCTFRFSVTCCILFTHPFVTKRPNACLWCLFCVVSLNCMLRVLSLRLPIFCGVLRTKTPSLFGSVIGATNAPNPIHFTVYSLVQALCACLATSSAPRHPTRSSQTSVFTRSDSCFSRSIS